MKSKTSLRKIFLFAALASLITVNTPAKAADAVIMHSGGQNWITWNPNGAVLNSDTSMQQDFTPLVIPGSRISTVGTTGYTSNWCWQSNSGKGSVQMGSNSVDQICGRVDIEGFSNTSSKTTRAQFTLVIIDAIAVATGNSGSSCSTVKHSEIDAFKNGRTDTLWAVCNKTFDLSPEVTYTLKVSNDSSRGADWWTASMYNNSTKQSTQLGSIKSSPALYDKGLSYLSTAINYWGEQVACDAVPVMDTIFSDFKFDSSNVSPSIKDFSPGSCINATMEDISSPIKGHLVKIGGVDPSSRKISLSTQQSGISIGSNNTINNTVSNNNVVIGSNNNIVIKPTFQR